MSQTSLELDFAIRGGGLRVHEKENNSASQLNLNTNKKHFYRQARILFDGLMKGEIHNGDTAKDKYGMRDMIRRYHDLLDAGVLIESKVIPNSHGMIEIFMNEEQKEYNKKFITK